MKHTFLADAAMLSFSVRHSTSVSSHLVHGLDFLAVVAAGMGAHYLRFYPEVRNSIDAPEVANLVVLLTAGLATLFFSKVYKIWPGGSLASMVGRVTLGWILSWTVLLVLLVLTKNAEKFSRIWMVTWLLMGISTLWMARIAAFFVMANMRRNGYQHKRVLLCGDSKMLDTVKARIQEATWSGYEIVGTVALHSVSDLEKVDARLKPDEIWVSLDLRSSHLLEHVTQALRTSVANIRLLPDLMMYQILSHGMTIAVGIPMVDISVSPMFGGRRAVKLVEDYVVASIVLGLLSPLMLLIAVAIKVTSPGPVLFQQKRHGWNDAEIWVYKFRSMYVHQEEPGTVTQTCKGDARVTPLGRLLRKLSLDELPQFINVLQGRMSVVGPRPHALEHNEGYLHLIPKYALRHKVKPGITGWAQVCGYRGETDTIEKMETRIKHDIFYLENWSLWLDLKIIALTPLATLQNKNVY